MHFLSFFFFVPCCIVEERTYLSVETVDILILLLTS